MYPSISLGPFVFPVASLLYLLGAAVSLNVVERAAKLLKLDYNAIYATAVTGLVSGMIGITGGNLARESDPRTTDEGQ